MTTGSNKLDKYAKQVKHGNEFHDKFSNALLRHLTQRSLDYKVETIPGGFKVLFNGLEADFQYQPEERYFRIVNKGTTSPVQYTLTDTNLKDLVQRWDGTTVGIDFSDVCSIIINPALEDQIGAGYNLDNLV
jgi:hypothetical protein